MLTTHTYIHIHTYIHTYIIHTLLPVLDTLLARFAAIFALWVVTVLSGQTSFGCAMDANWRVGPHGIVQFFDGVIAMYDSDIHFCKCAIKFKVLELRPAGVCNVL